MIPLFAFLASILNIHNATDVTCREAETLVIATISVNRTERYCADTLGRRQGRLIITNSWGKLFGLGRYLNDARDGLWIELVDHRSMDVTMYHGDEPQWTHRYDTHVTWNDSDGIETIEILGNQTSIFFRLAPDGSLIELGHLLYPPEWRVGTWRTWWPDGRRQSILEYDDSNHAVSGQFFDQTGRPISPHILDQSCSVELVGDHPCGLPDLRLMGLSAFAFGTCHGPSACAGYYDFATISAVAWFALWQDVRGLLEATEEPFAYQGRTDRVIMIVSAPRASGGAYYYHRIQISREACDEAIVVPTRSPQLSFLTVSKCDIGVSASLISMPMIDGRPDYDHQEEGDDNLTREVVRLVAAAISLSNAEVATFVANGPVR